MKPEEIQSQTRAAILCVDDERVILDSLEMQLANYFGEEYLLEFMESAEEALEVIEELEKSGVQVLVLISDWLMPGMKGDELFRQVYRVFPHVFQILLTGHADAEAVRRARQEGNLHKCIYKPWKERELIGAVEEAVEFHSGNSAEEQDGRDD